MVPVRAPRASDVSASIAVCGLVGTVRGNTVKASWSCVCLILRHTLRVCFAGAPAGCGEAVKACAATWRAERYTVCVCADATVLNLERPSCRQL